MDTIQNLVKEYTRHVHDIETEGILIPNKLTKSNEIIVIIEAIHERDHVIIILFIILAIALIWIVKQVHYLLPPNSDKI